MVSPGRPWRALSATALGSSHTRRGMPNQDAVAVRVVAGRGAVAALSDGHGGTRYVRSDVGSRLAVEVALEAAAGLVAGLPADTRADRAQRLALEALGAPVVARWRELVLAHVDAHPFTAAERERAGASLDGEPLISYGATLLVAVATPTLVLAVQLGDGDIAVARSTGEVVTPVPGDERLVGGETTSLCLPDAVADLRVGVVEGGALVVLLASDGYGNAFADPQWRPTVVADIGRHLAESGEAHVATNLPTWLADSAEIGGDDVTVALLHCVGDHWPVPVTGARTRRAVAPVAGIERPRTPVPADPTARRWSTGIVIATLVGGLLVGGGGGLVLGRHTGATSPTTESSTVPSTTAPTSSTTTTPATTSPPTTTPPTTSRPTTSSPSKGRVTTTSATGPSDTPTQITSTNGSSSTTSGSTKTRTP